MRGEAVQALICVFIHQHRLKLDLDWSSGIPPLVLLLLSFTSCSGEAGANNGQPREARREANLFQPGLFLAGLVAGHKL